MKGISSGLLVLISAAMILIGIALFLRFTPGDPEVTASQVRVFQLLSGILIGGGFALPFRNPWYMSVGVLIGVMFLRPN